MPLEGKEECLSTTYVLEPMILSYKLTIYYLNQLVTKDGGICGLAHKYWSFIQLNYTQNSMKVAIEIQYFISDSS